MICKGGGAYHLLRKPLDTFTVEVIRAKETLQTSFADIDDNHGSEELTKVFAYVQVPVRNIGKDERCHLDATCQFPPRYGNLQMSNQYHH